MPAAMALGEGSNVKAAFATRAVHGGQRHGPVHRAR